MNATIPATQNDAWGFWGTMGDHASVAWPLAVRAVSDATGEDAEVVRAFLDSRFGRHFRVDGGRAVHFGRFDCSPPGIGAEGGAAPASGCC